MTTMAACFRCGRARVGRFCAHCGAQARSIAPPVRRQKSRLLLIGLLFLLSAFLTGLFGLRFSVQPRMLMRTDFTSVPQNAGLLLDDANAILVSAQANFQVFANTVTGLRSRQTTVASQISDANNFRQRLAIALRQARYEGRWPLVVSNFSFSQPQDVEAAMDKADQYLQHAAQNQAEILRENAQLDQTQRRAERIVQSMTQIRERMTYTPATTSLQNDDRQLQTLNLDLQNTLAQLQNINARKVDLRPFSLFN
jgi:hypothetical protein